MVERSFLEQARTNSIIGRDLQEKIGQRQPLIDSGKAVVKQSKDFLANHFKDRLALQVKEEAPEGINLKKRQFNALVNRRFREMLLLRNRPQAEAVVADDPQLQQALEDYHSNLKSLRQQQRLTYKEKKFLNLGISQPHDEAVSPFISSVKQLAAQPQVEKDSESIYQAKQKAEQAWVSLAKAKKEYRSPTKALIRDLQSGWQILWQRQPDPDPEEKLSAQKRQYLDKRNEYAALLIKNELPYVDLGGRVFREKLADSVVSKVSDIEAKFLRQEVDLNNHTLDDKLRSWFYHTHPWRLGGILALGAGYMIADKLGVAPQLGLFKESVAVGGALLSNSLANRLVVSHSSDKGEITLNQAKKMPEGSRMLMLAKLTENRIGQGKSEPGKSELNLLQAEKLVVRDDIVQMLSRYNGRKLSASEREQLLYKSLRRTDSLHPYHEVLAFQSPGILFWLYTASIVSGYFAQRLGLLAH